MMSPSRSPSWSRVVALAALLALSSGCESAGVVPEEADARVEIDALEPDALEPDALAGGREAGPPQPDVGDLNEDIVALDAALLEDARVIQDVRPDCQPTPEVCDGLDDDCDGVVDNVPEAGTPCEAGLGRCLGQGVQVCQAGALICNAVVGAPEVERCDGLDNDCDGVVDNGFDGVGEPCTLGVGACAAAGAVICDAAGELACDARPDTPVAEVCDGIDNDCDGVVDDVVGVGGPCEVGQGACAGVGVQICNSFGALICDGIPGEPAAEICDGVDNDCDGAVDNFDEGSCEVGEGACRGPGRIVCEGDLQRCEGSPLAPSEEICDEIDNDCDGVVDNLAQLGAACEAGEGDCHTVGLWVCEAGRLRCQGDPVQARPEVCNNIDDDCDGQIDEEIPPNGSCTAGNGACQMEGPILCEAGAWRCAAVPGAPVDEICNNLDDDCDLQVDNVRGVGELCEVGLGQCRSVGEMICGVDALGCNARPRPPRDEVCDGLDNNCDGRIDEGGACNCGNGVLDVGEDCEDGNDVNGDGCDGDCTFEDFEIIGSRYTQTEAIAQAGYDRYRFHSDGSSRLVVYTSDEGGVDCPDRVDTTVGVLDEDTMQSLAYNDDEGMSLCSRIEHVLPEGDFIIEVRGFSDQAVFQYQLNFALDRIVERSGSYSGNFVVEGDDSYSFTASRDGYARFRVSSLDGINCPFDAQATLFDGLGDRVDWIDDYHGLCPYISMYAKAGESYRLLISPLFPQLRPSPYELRAQLLDVEPQGLAMGRGEDELMDYGWRRCMSGPYDGSIPLANVMGGCQGEELLMGCRPMGESELQLSAHGLKDLVTFDVGDERAPPENPHHGLNWYFSGGASWGFVPLGLPLQRMSCDAEANIASALRLCWHTSGDALTSGYRCGADRGVGADFERVVFRRSGEHIQLGARKGFGHHGTCGAWNECEDGAGCAAAACALHGHGAALRWEEGHSEDPQVNDSDLFRSLPDDVDVDWISRPNCDMAVAYGVVCAPR